MKRKVFIMLKFKLKNLMVSLFAATAMTTTVYAETAPEEVIIETQEIRTNTEQYIDRASEAIKVITPEILTSNVVVPENKKVEEPKSNEPINPKEEVVLNLLYLDVLGDLNMRTAPSVVDGKVMGVVTKNSLVISHGRHSNGWYLLSNGWYVSDKYVKIANITSYDEFLSERQKRNDEKKRLAEEAAKQAQAAKAKQQQKQVQTYATSGASAYANIKLSDADVTLLAQLVYAEARGESFEGQVAVAKVVFNRMLSSSFPNTLREIVYQKNQFSPVINGSINNSPTQTQYDVINTALASSDNLGGALYFYAPSLVKSPYMEKLQTVAVVGVHHFKK